MSLLRNEKAVYSPEYGTWHTEALCPYCRHWKITWGAESTRRGRRVCSSCTWALERREKEKWGCIA